ncbi:GTPase [Tautonia marina]|uniref:GTPase n=1 Tax=Tautonia marina TaxID=2653855 RepID=UPI0012609FBD|nr:GTPase [Tautonia marina]
MNDVTGDEVPNPGPRGSTWPDSQASNHEVVPRRGPFLSLLTSPARGAIAVLRVWGEGAVEAADRVFRPHRGVRLAESSARRPRVGRVGRGTGDEVVALILKDNSRLDEVEFQCHGGPAAVAMVVEALEQVGVCQRSADDWVRVQQSSLVRALAHHDLAHAETDRVARHLLAQAQGALDEALDAIRSRLSDDPSEAIERLNMLIDRAEVGCHLVSGWRVALAGRPNVGKSRLLNALAGYGRAIVSSTPGTTRDVVTARIAIDGWPVEVADTAGLRVTQDPIEAGGVSLARSRHGGADLVLLILDQSEPFTETDRGLIKDYENALIVCNKRDLVAVWEPDASWGEVKRISAERGDGLESLVATISRRLVPDPPQAGEAIPFREPQRQHLIEVRRLLQAGCLEQARTTLDQLQAGAS